MVTLIPSPNNHTVFGTFLGGSGSDEANAVAVDDLGVESKVYVAGSTDSADFPGIRRRSHSSSLVGREAFVVQLDKGLHEIEEATFLGGSGVDEARAITASLAGFMWPARPAHLIFQAWTPRLRTTRLAARKVSWLRSRSTA